MRPLEDIEINNFCIRHLPYPTLMNLCHVRPSVMQAQYYRNLVGNLGTVGVLRGTFGTLHESCLNLSGFLSCEKRFGFVPTSVFPAGESPPRCLECRSGFVQMPCRNCLCCLAPPLLSRSPRPTSTLLAGRAGRAQMEAERQEKVRQENGGVIDFQPKHSNPEASDDGIELGEGSSMHLSEKSTPKPKPGVIVDVPLA